jgi:chemotaxis receptor (MCP) glutamine deamidase CheD
VQKIVGVGEMKINLYGGANSIRTDDIFNVERKNIEAVKDLLGK